MKFDEDWRVFCKGRLNTTSFDFELQVLIPRSVEEQEEEKGEYEGLKMGIVMKIEELLDWNGWRDKVKALLQAISSVFFSLLSSFLFHFCTLSVFILQKKKNRNRDAFWT